jgi:ubiquinone/menaquinone biosynthesis C-methylase UbiE
VSVDDAGGVTLFREIHTGLPRESPGDAASTRRAFRTIRGLPAAPRILDVGCGPGAQTLDLAAVTAARICAFDIHRPYLDEVRARVQAGGVAGRVQLVQASMLAMPFAAESVDVIWAEGSIYIAGFEPALRGWRGLLRRGGFMAVSELSWLEPDAPEEPRAFWNRHYPAMHTIEQNVAAAKDSGFDVIDSFTLPESSWWADYYSPMEARLSALRARYSNDAEALATIESSQSQIDLYRRFTPYYGYVFYVLQRRES